MWHTFIRLAAGLSVPVLLAGAAEPAAAQDRVVITARSSPAAGHPPSTAPSAGFDLKLLRPDPSGSMLYFSERRPARGGGRRGEGGSGGATGHAGR